MTHRKPGHCCPGPARGKVRGWTWAPSRAQPRGRTQASRGGKTGAGREPTPSVRTRKLVERRFSCVLSGDARSLMKWHLLSRSVSSEANARTVPCHYPLSMHTTGPGMEGSRVPARGRPQPRRPPSVDPSHSHRWGTLVGATSPRPFCGESRFYLELERMPSPDSPRGL